MKNRLLSALCFTSVIFLFGSILPGYVQAQNRPNLYSTGIGVRLGNAPGITLKKMLNETSALEAQLEAFRITDYEGFIVTALYEWHTNAFQVPRLNWYFGGGVHAGAYDRRTNEEVINTTESDSNGVLYGLDATVGLEYKFPEWPFTVGADVKPSLTFPTNRASAINGAVNLRWVW